jgi:roadblock/LC7 domain-containing protein
MVGDQQVFKILSTNVAIAMANLERLLNMLEYQDVRTSIRAHLIAAMGQTVDLLRRMQAISYTEVTSDQSR